MRKVLFFVGGTTEIVKITDYEWIIALLAADYFRNLNGLKRNIFDN